MRGFILLAALVVCVGCQEKPGSVRDTDPIEDYGPTKEDRIRAARREFELLPQEKQKKIISLKNKLKTRPVIRLTQDERLQALGVKFLTDEWWEYRDSVFDQSGGPRFFKNMNIKYDKYFSDEKAEWFELFDDGDCEIAMRISRKYLDAGKSFSTLDEKEKRFVNQHRILFQSTD